jgi:hypothetical protein
MISEKYPQDVESRQWSSQIQDALKERKDASFKELDRMWEGLQHCPINYDHYFTDTVKRQQMKRMKGNLVKAIKNRETPTCYKSAIVSITFNSNIKWLWKASKLYKVPVIGPWDEDL